MWMRANRYWAPALSLFLLSPIIGELLSGSSPPIEFFNPLAFVFMAGLYGSGALIARELAFRWKKGWLSILVLGAAYGIIEEGLEVKSFFDPNWMDLGPLGSYGRFLGVNWVWSVELTVYHAVFSIAIPILLVSLLFPKEIDRAWVSDRTLRILFTVLILNVVLGFLFLTDYRPPFSSYLIAMGLVVSLFVLAYSLPQHWFEPRGGLAARPKRFYLLGLSFATGLFLISWIIPSTGIPALLTIAALILLFYLSFRLLLRWSSNGHAWSQKHQLALAAGMLTFLITIAFVQEMWGPSNMVGMSLVALAFTVFLLYLWSRMGGKGSPKAPPEYRISNWK